MNQKKIKILTYNIHKGFDFFGMNYIIQEIKQQIQKLDVDIVLLQEVAGQRKKPSSIHKAEAQLEYLADQIWSEFSYGKNAIYPNGHHGNAILSKFPIVQFNNHSLTLHRFEQRGLLHCEIEFEKNKRLHILNTHLNLRASDRLKQVDIIYKYIQNQINPMEPLLLGGDFNDWNFKVHDFISDKLGFKDSHHEVNLNFAKTFPSLSPFLCLDRLYTRNLKPIAAESLNSTAWKSLSDHLPLYTELIIKDF